MGVKFTDDEPIYGRRLRVPTLAPLVHLASPMFQVPLTQEPYPAAFTGKYITCCGILDGNIFEKTHGKWETWVLPKDTALTCLQCIMTEDKERGRR